jgi:hypothetical protein
VIYGNGVIAKTKNSVEPKEDQRRKFGEDERETTDLPKAKARPGSLVASAKSRSEIWMSPMHMVSWETKPSIEPEPYWMENSDPLALYVVEAEESYLAWRKHAMEVHLELGTQRLLDPVSRMTLN